MKRFWVALLVLGAAGCARNRSPLPVLGHIPEFQLTSQTGQPFDRTGLEGKVWVADFVFTSCRTSCPRMSSQMRAVQQKIAKLPDVRLVSFTVDPEHDTPAVLADYARRFEAQEGRWFFLTGSRSELNSLAYDAFKLNSVDGSLNHSTRFVLVDQKCRIRGYYSTAEDDSAIGSLIADVERLARGKS